MIKNRKLLLLLLIPILLACAVDVKQTTVSHPQKEPETTECNPNHIRWDCGLTISGKYECGYRYFLTDGCP